jgi:hypothetical protein
MFCKKLCCDITIHLVTINFQSCTHYSVTPCILYGFEFGENLRILRSVFKVTFLRALMRFQDDDIPKNNLYFYANLLYRIHAQNIRKLI